MGVKGKPHSSAARASTSHHGNSNFRAYSHSSHSGVPHHHQPTQQGSRLVARSNNFPTANQQQQQSVKGGFEGPMVAPWRKTVSIFKQPVTLVRTTSRETRAAPSNELQAASRAGTGRQDKPKQVFWAKRLEGLRAMMPISAEEIPKIKERDNKSKLEEEEDMEEGDNATSDDFAEVLCIDGEPTSVPESLTLPSRIQPVGPDVTEDVAAASLTSALQAPPFSGSTTQHLVHPHQPPITGQTNPKKHLDSNPGVFTNPDQPLIHAVVVSDQDITAQEHRVLDARRRLEEAMKHFG